MEKRCARKVGASSRAIGNESAIIKREASKMLTKANHQQALELLLRQTTPVATEQLPLADCAGRILAQDFYAAYNVPPFDRSAYDGYAFRAADISNASQEHPVTLRILGETAAGDPPFGPLQPGTAVKILTGAPIPPGADAVAAYETTRYTQAEVTVMAPALPGANIVTAGEDVAQGQLLAQAGSRIDVGLMGTLASQGVVCPKVFRLPQVGILSTGEEVVEPPEPLIPGKIWNTNRYAFTAAIHSVGCVPRYLGLVGDSAQQIAAHMEQGLKSCDVLISTGGVSVGDYDFTLEAMRLVGATPLISGLRIKPGMACAFAMRDGKLLCGLSGNPASAMTSFWTVLRPVLYKLAGCRSYLPAEITLTLAQPFPKASRQDRFLRGKLDLSDGIARFHIPQKQGNTQLSSAIGCDAIALIPAGSGPLQAGTQLKGFLL